MINSLPGFENYLSFFNSLGLSVRLIRLVEAIPHSSTAIAGWQGLLSLTCLGEDRQLYDIDIRYAWGSEIFKQNLVDHGWSEATLLHKKDKQEPTRHKLIIYLCENFTNLDKSQKIEPVPDRFLIGGYWQSIHHIYLLLPVEHPFDIPDFDVKTSIAGYSSTRSLTKNQPKINPDSQIASYLFLPANSERTGEGGLRTKGLWKQSTPEQTLISVITVVFNGAKYIEQTIQSVINQLYDNVEYIIIDGGSTDETIKIIRKYEDYIDYWVSEKDEGIYQAMNKGISLVSGQWLNFLGCDDIFYDFEAVLSIKNEFYNVMMIYGNSFFEGNIPIRSTFSPKILFHNTINHQSAFYNSTLFEKWKYDNQLKLIADYELNLMLYKNKLPVKKVEFNITISKDKGLSRTLFSKVIEETSYVREKQLGSFLNLFIHPIFLLKFLIYLIGLKQHKLINNKKT